MSYRLISLLGLFAMIAVAWALSENRKRVNWRLVASGVALQGALGLLVLKTHFGEAFFEWVRSGFEWVTASALEGSRFVFGNLTQVIVLNPGAVAGEDGPFVINAIIAFKVLPIVIVVSALAALLYHLRIIQGLVRLMTALMRRTFKTSGAETFGASMLVFLGIESLPALKGYLAVMTRSELCTVMTVFMATVAADVMVIYAGFGAEPGHLLAASLMSAPAAILIAKLLVPETESPKTQGKVQISVEVESHNMIDAVAKGGSEGLNLALNIGALLIVFVSLIYLINQGMTAITGHSFTEVMGWFFYPFAFLMGVPREEIASVAQLLGTKTVVNEFIAYTDMKALIDAGLLSPRAATISTYALCGFANPGSLGILLAGLGALIPERRKEVTQLGFKSFVGGTLAAFMTACVAGILTP